MKRTSGVAETLIGAMREINWMGCNGLKRARGRTAALKPFIPSSFWSEREEEETHNLALEKNVAGG